MNHLMALETHAQPVRRGEIEVLGMRTQWVEAGPEDASEAVVLLHGTPGSAADWEDVLPQIGQLGRVVAFDLPGYGGADKPNGLDYSSSSYAIFIGAALERLGIARAHLVMHDLGATGLLWAAAQPRSVGSLTLVDTGVLLGYRWHLSARMYRTPLLGELMIKTATRRAFRAMLRRYNRSARPLPDAAIERMWKDHVPASRRAALRFYRATSTEVMELIQQPLRALNPPTLVIWGGHDPAVPVEHAERQRETFPRAEVVILNESGHWPMLDDPKAFAGVLLPFLRRQLRPTPEDN